MTIGERIKKLRRDMGVTQDELAIFAHTTKQTIHKYEVGIIKNIPASKIKLLADKLNTTPAYLMGWDDPEQEDNSQLADIPSPKEAREKLVLMGYRYLDETDKGIIMGEIRQMLRDEKYKDTDFTL